MKPVAEMNLEEYLASNSQSSVELLIHSWFGCLAKAFAYLHARKIKHRDVKPANILVRGADVYVTDYSISTNVWDKITTASTHPVDARTLMYCAPEVATTEEGLGRGRALDVFSRLRVS
ncbi:hypothetical protein K469DRAFT_706675 [Zopfia rhizophila CBS 207.26]|uniref:Protein kinase domain-containing protein n=1 Tax=Zopfia rhizophila CBS 207.26 TaxID=1314779 RepID=A0A6A6E428_9PEZI|nr:hypothetical protein K469DRAFT_706675 [Zopfia rhizophila CBS 207.26]